MWKSRGRASPPPPSLSRCPLRLARGDDVLTVDAQDDAAIQHERAARAVVVNVAVTSAPLQFVGAGESSARCKAGDAQAVVVLTGDEDLKPALRSRLEALGIGLGATANAGALVVPGAEARGFVLGDR